MARPENRRVFEYRITARDGAARRGVIRTDHGEMETPGFFAVATRATLKGLDPAAARSVGIEALICNGYHLAVQPGPVSQLGTKGVLKPAVPSVSVFAPLTP